MSEHEHVAPGDLPAVPVPGWYADPGNPGHARLWDGERWTGQVVLVTALAPESAVGGVHEYPQGAGFGCVFYAGVVLVLLALITGALVLALQHAPKINGGEAGAVGACRSFMAARLQNPNSAEFSEVEVIEPVSGEQWTVSGVVTSDTTTGRMARTDFTCIVQPVEGDWRLVSLRFLTL